jgi:DNA-binding transcriptional LysR family regulator
VDFRHLRAFVTVAEERNFTRAARRLHISQPPLTRQVRQLEQELGFPLFVRHRSGVDLTCEGRTLLGAARAITTAVGAFEHSAQVVRHRQAQTVNIGIGWGLWPAVNLIRQRYAQRFPDVPIAARDLCDEHRGENPSQHIDVAVMRPPVEGPLVSEPLFQERFVALLGDSHPLASRPSVRLGDLAAEPLLLFDRSIGPAVYDKILALWHRSGIRPVIVEQQPPPYAQGAMMLVASRQGYYLGIASQFTQTHSASGVAVVPLDEPDARLDVLVVWRKDEPSTHVREFVRVAHEVFRHPPRTARA